MIVEGSRRIILSVATVSGYSRPGSLDEALALLDRPGAVVLGGGTKVNATAGAEPIEVVDLQALGLDGTDVLDGGAVRFGAMVTLQRLVECGDLPEAVRESARRELPSTLRAQATLGGTIAVGDPESELLATLLVHDAVVGVANAEGPRTVSLEELLEKLPPEPGSVVVAVTIAVTGRSFVARVGRTRADRPIVAAAARIAPDGLRRLALSGVAATPILVEDLEGLDPPSDFRGSGEYRRALAEVLASRALEALS